MSVHKGNLKISGVLHCLSVIKHACILLARSQARSLIAAGTWGSPAPLRGERTREKESASEEGEGLLTCYGTGVF